MGSAYTRNYGLSLQHIRDIARDIKNSQEYALSLDEVNELWATRWREMMLIGIACMDPQTLSMETVMTWAATMPTPEAAEAMAFLLTGQMPCAPTLAKELLNRNSAYDYTLACHTAARAVNRIELPNQDDRLNKESTNLETLNDVVSSAIQMAPQALTSDQTTSNAMALSFLLRRCVVRGIAKETIAQFESQATESDNAALRSVADDVAAEREML